MKFLIASALLLSSPAFAMNHYKSRSMSCDALKALVKKEKVVLLTAGISGGRFVASSKFCTALNEKTVANAYMPAADTRFCNPGILCRYKFPGE